MGMEMAQDGSLGEVTAFSDVSCEEQLERLKQGSKLIVGAEDELKRIKAIKEGIDREISSFRLELLVLENKVNKIIIHLGIDDKSEILTVKDLPKDIKGGE